MLQLADNRVAGEIAQGLIKTFYIAFINRCHQGILIESRS